MLDWCHLLFYDCRYKWKPHFCLSCYLPENVRIDRHQLLLWKNSSKAPEIYGLSHNSCILVFHNRSLRTHCKWLGLMLPLPAIYVNPIRIATPSMLFLIKSYSLTRNCATFHVFQALFPAILSIYVIFYVFRWSIMEWAYNQIRDNCFWKEQL